MASSLQTLIPNGSDYPSSTFPSPDWDLIGGISTPEDTLNDSSLGTYLSSADVGDHNTFTFTDITVADHLNCQWIAYEIYFGTSVARAQCELRISIIDGATGSPLFTTTYPLKGPSHTAKFDSILGVGIYPYSTGTTAWTETQVNNIQIKIECYNPDLSGGGNAVEIESCKVLAMMKDSDPDPPGTYDVSDTGNIELKNGLISLKGGLINV